MRPICHALRAEICTMMPPRAPLAEQRRIVAKVEQLMALVAALEQHNSPPPALPPRISSPPSSPN